MASRFLKHNIDENYVQAQERDSKGGDAHRLSSSASSSGLVGTELTGNDSTCASAGRQDSATSAARASSCAPKDVSSAGPADFKPGISTSRISQGRPQAEIHRAGSHGDQTLATRRQTHKRQLDTQRCTDARASENLSSRPYPIFINRMALCGGCASQVQSPTRAVTRNVRVEEAVSAPCCKDLEFGLRGVRTLTSSVICR